MFFYVHMHSITVLYGIFTEFVWQCFGASCYNFNTVKIRKNYADAKAHCISLGGHVIAVETEEEGELVNEVHHAPAGKFILTVCDLLSTWKNIIYSKFLLHTTLVFIQTPISSQ